MVDYIAYIDTDSLYIKIGEYLETNFPDFYKENKDDVDKMKKIIISISKLIEKKVNEGIYTEVQKGQYASKIEDFKIELEQELVAKSALFIRKKRYAYWDIIGDKVSVKGIEIVRSETPKLQRKYLKNVVDMIIRGYSDEEINEAVKEAVKKMKDASVYDIAANIGVKNLNKYINSKNELKTVYNKSGGRQGTPWHVKGVANYRQLCKLLNIDNKYEGISEGTKAKVIYLKANPYKIDVITFTDWPKEFDDIIIPDKNKMIENYFISKISTILTPINKEHLTNTEKNGVDIFF